MRLYKENAKNLIGKRVDCYKRMFGNYPLIIKQRDDGTIYTKDTHGTCCDVPEKENDFNCYHFDFVVIEKIREVVEYFKANNVKCKISTSNADDYQDCIAVFAYGNLTREQIVDQIKKNNLCVIFFESSIKEDEYMKMQASKNDVRQGRNYVENIF